jgi:alkanesulfonate monooxygenase
MIPEHNGVARDRFEVFATCPQSSRYGSEDYLDRVIETARWSDEYGYDGILVYSDHSLVDPWLVATEILSTTSTLAPLVAVQPATMHPHTAAKMVATLSFLYGRRIYLNMIAGGFAGDLAAIGDSTPHDRRYERLQAFTELLVGLTDGRSMTTDGEWYRAEALKLAPSVPEALRPGILMSGSSPAGLATAAALGATAVQYPQPAGELLETPPGLATGIRVGIIGRESAEEAWRVAHDRFPPSRRGELLHEMAMARSDSQWHATLSKLAEESAAEQNAYWLGPFQNYDTFCPYLVGSYDEVATELARYWHDGHRTVILDIPPSNDDLAHTAVVFARVDSLVDAA